jgi:hypothetical protein
LELDEVIALINSDDGKELPLSSLEKGVPEVMGDGRPAIEKSSFRKKLARKTGNPPGVENVYFIVENFVLRLHPFPNNPPKGIGVIEFRLIEHYQPDLNPAGVRRNS